MRRRRWFAVLSGSLAAACVFAAFALWSFIDALGPLDLSAAEKRSTVVLDRDGRLLRPFATADGRWRLPVAAAEVDPRFLAMLTAYEDRRFDRHRGIDPMALLRAAGQLLGHGRVVSGGSTLTMQVARLLEPREERTLAAKAAPARARGAARAAAVEAGDPRPLSHARSLWRQPRGHARGDARLFRPRAEAPVLCRGGAPRGAAAGARDAPPRPLRRRRAGVPATGCSTGPCRAASSTPPKPRPRSRKTSRPRGGRFRSSPRTRPKPRSRSARTPRSIGSRSTAGCRRASRRWCASASSL